MSPQPVNFYFLNYSEVPLIITRVTLKIEEENFIEPHKVQYNLKHFYYTTMQKLWKFEALSGLKNQCKSHKVCP